MSLTSDPAGGIQCCLYVMDIGFVSLQTQQAVNQIHLYRAML